MSWKETCVMNEKVLFIADVQDEELTFTEACRRRGISRKTGYKLWQRYGAEGAAGLQPRSRAPLHHPNAVNEAVIAQLLAARRRHPSRPYPRRLPPVEYPHHYEVRRVHRAGDIRWHGRSLYVSEALGGEPVGLEQIDDACWRLYYGMLPLGTFDPRAARGARIEPITSIEQPQKVLPMCPV